MGYHFRDLSTVTNDLVLWRTPYHDGGMGRPGFCCLCGAAVRGGLVGRSSCPVPEPALAAPRSVQPGPGGVLLVLDLLRCRGIGRALRHRLPTHIRSEEHTSELQSRENLVCRL